MPQRENADSRQARLLALDTANLKDPAADAAVWEKVVRKIGVGAMPPQGIPTPGNAELNKFRNALITTLDSAAAKKNNPGPLCHSPTQPHGIRQCDS